MLDGAVTIEKPKLRRLYETIRREQNAMSSRLLFMRLCREHYKYAPDEYKRKYVPSTIVGSPWDAVGIRTSRAEIPAMECPIQQQWFDELSSLPKHSVRRVQNVVARQYRITVNELISPCRAQRLCRPRFVAYYLARKHTPCSLPEIARRFGGRDHSSIHHGLRKMEKMMAADSQLAGLVAHLSGKLA